MNEQTGMKIFPFYVVVDTSTSMNDCLHALNSELPALKQAVEDDPIVGELARFSLITFSDIAEQKLPLSDLDDVASMPHLTAAGSTSYAAAFQFLENALPYELEWYKNEGFRPLRPVVFFITDGHPNEGDPWRQWRDQITSPDFAYRPHIVAFGFGQVEQNTLAEVATFKAYAAQDGHNPAAVLKTITEALTQSIVASSRSASGGQTSLMMPTTIDGMYEIPLDTI